MLGVGVGLLLRADLGSDGYSSLANGISLALDLPFWIANLAVGAVFLAVAASRRVRPGIGTVAQIAVVGATINVVLALVDRPDGWPGRIALLVLAFPVLAVGIATYLGSRTGAGPAEAAALAWDPPVPFKWGYGVVQCLGAAIGWLLGATIGVGTIATIFLLGPLVDLAARLLRLDVHQAGAQERRQRPARTG